MTTDAKQLRQRWTVEFDHDSDLDRLARHTVPQSHRVRSLQEIFTDRAVIERCAQGLAGTTARIVDVPPARTIHAAIAVILPSG